MNERKTERTITVTLAARQCQVSRRTVRRYVRRGLVDEPLTPEDLVTLRRIRRLTELGVNLAGVEVILHMRRRILELQAEMERLRGAREP